MDIALSGNLTADPELRFTPGGIPVADLRIAENRPFKDRDGDWQQETAFYSAIAWRDLAEHAAGSLHKGDRVTVIGRLRQEEWTADGGDKRRRYVIDAADIGASVKFATVAVTKNGPAGNAEPAEYSDTDPERPF